MSTHSPARDRLQPLLARIGLLAIALTVVAAILVADFATAPHVASPQAAAETWALHLLTHDGRELGGHPDGMELTLSPLLHFENRPAAGSGNRYRINSLGLRGPEISHSDDGAAANENRSGDGRESPRPVVAVVGGSAVFGMFVPEEMTFCRLLADRFPDLEVVNGGAIGYLSGQETALVALKLLDLKPALVIACDGWNDCYDGTLWHQATGQEHAVRGVNSSFQIMENRLAEYRRTQLEPRAATAAWLKTCLARSRALGWLTHTSPEPAVGPYPEEFLDRAAETYVDNLVRMHRLVTGQGGRLIVALQPEAGQLTGPPPDHPLTGRLDSEQYARFRRRASERLQALSVEVTDLSVRLAAKNHSGRALFLDPVHLSPEGHKQAANLLESYLADVRREAR